MEQGSFFAIAKNLERLSMQELTHEATFDKFWPKYPRKEGKKQAFIEWKKIPMSRSKFTQIMQGLEAHNRKWKKEERQKKYIPLPKTWIKNVRWEDELDELEDLSPIIESGHIKCAICNKRPSYGAIDGVEMCVQCWRER